MEHAISQARIAIQNHPQDRAPLNIERNTLERAHSELGRARQQWDDAVKAYLRERDA